MQTRALHFTDIAAAANCMLRGFVVGHKVSNARRNATAFLFEKLFPLQNNFSESYLVIE